MLSSLRARVWFGAILWTLGLLAGTTIAIELSRSLREHIQIIHAYSHAAGLFALVCMVVGFALVTSALAPFERIRRRLVDIRRGGKRRMEGAYPSEVQPLVDDLNALLDHRDEAVRRAIAKAGDLAHGLKTPLAVLAQEAERASAAGRLDEADAIAQQVERMRRQIDYHLAHARATASSAASGARSSILASAEGLARTLQRLHAERGVAIRVAVDAHHEVRCQREDVDEMLGNLLDNACKWARAQVVVSSLARDASVVISVEDDGPGLDPSMREAVLQRGVRADEAAPGSGLGLAIVRDLAELYGGSIALDSAPLGGLRATLSLPAV